MARFARTRCRALAPLSGVARPDAAPPPRRPTGNWSPNQTHTYISGEATLRVADTVEALRELVPPELYDVVAATAAQPPVEDPDI